MVLIRKGGLPRRYSFDMQHPSPTDDSAADGSRSKVLGAIKNPIWATVGTVAGVAALVVTYLQVSHGPGPAEIEVANVSFGSPAPIEARSGPSYIDAAEWDQTTEPATPIDITLKNNGGAPAHIVRIETKVLDAKTIDCSRQGGGSVVSAFYGVKIQYNPWQMKLSADTVSSPVDYTVKAGSVDRMVITVGPEESGNGKPVVFAVQLRLIPEQGEPITLEPFALSQPDLVESQIHAASFLDYKNTDPRCVRETADELNNVFNATKMQSPDVVRLRDTFQHLVTP